MKKSKYKAEITVTVHSYYEGEADTILKAVRKAYEDAPEMVEYYADGIEIYKDGKYIADFYDNSKIRELLHGRMVKADVTFEDTVDSQLLAIGEELDDY